MLHNDEEYIINQWYKFGGKWVECSNGLEYYKGGTTNGLLINKNISYDYLKSRVIELCNYHENEVLLHSFRKANYG